jgi:hypothetical protein
MKSRSTFVPVPGSVLALAASLSLSHAALAGGVVGPQIFDLRTDWSNATNPNGAWSYLEGNNPLPFVASWQGTIGGWGTAQPGWARSEDGTNRLPFWYRSNGTETFSPDLQAGDIVLHTTDQSNGVGNGEGRVRWTAPARGTVTITGSTWAAREIGRSNTWTLLAGSTMLRTGVVASGDQYSRANPFNFASGTGTEPITNRLIGCGGTIIFEATRNTVAGDFVGVNMTIAFTPAACAGDINGDSIINTADLTSFLGQFGQSGAGLCADLNNDGAVNTADLVIFLGRFGQTCP